MPIRVAYISSIPALPVAGAYISVYERFSLLSKHGVLGSVISLAASEQRDKLLRRCESLNLELVRSAQGADYKWRGSISGSITFGESLGKFDIAAQPEVDATFDRVLKEGSFEVILANARDFSALLYLSRRNYHHAIFLVTEDEYPRPDDFGGEHELKKAFSCMPRVAVASKFLRDSLKHSWNIEARVLHNSIDFDFYSTQTPPGHAILGLQPYEKKGVRVFAELARVMPERRFALASGFGPEYRKIKPELDQISNIATVPFNADVRSLYAISRLVLVPSVWQEAFSRVVLEALASGRPVIASRVGGIPETGGEAILYVNKPELSPTSQNLVEWRQAIEGLDDPTLFKACVKKGYEQVEISREKTKRAILEWEAWLREEAASM